MSYILEALKKSEQERQQGNVPGLQTLPLQLQDSAQSSRWPYVVIGMLALSLVFVLGWMRPWAPQQHLVAIQNSVNTAEAVASTPVQANNARASVFVPEPDTAAVKSYIVQRPTPVEPSLFLESVPHLRDMPPLVQQAIPDMEFAGHVYSSNAEQRSVIINDRSMAEGETIVDGLKVEQITQKGVVFDYQNQLFQMPILQDWAFD
ncbi:MAG: general secretion pathway protein GspB [Gammaproteobacteria bacterium]